jgi:hypothetical protein
MVARCDGAPQSRERHLGLDRSPFCSGSVFNLQVAQHFAARDEGGRAAWVIAAPDVADW